MLNLKPHEYRKLPNSELHGLVRINPYLRLSVREENGNQAVVYIQEGEFFDAAGKPLPTDDDVPDWVWDELAKVSVEAKKSVGLVKEPAALPPEEAA